MGLFSLLVDILNVCSALISVIVSSPFLELLREHGGASGSSIELELVFGVAFVSINSRISM